MITLDESVRKNAADKLYSAVIADILDDKGVRDFSMDPGMGMIVESPVFGRALTVLASDVYAQPEKPYAMEIAAIDSVRAGDVFVATVNGTECNGFFGELLATAARCKGGCGAVIDGYVRDIRKLREMRFPMYARGHSPLDSKGRCDVTAINTAIVCGGVRIHPGDYIFGDEDGIVAIPNRLVGEVVEAAFAKVSGENTVRDAIMGGMSMKNAFEKFGIL